MSLTPPPKVQKLRTTLHAKAKGSPEYRFYRLYDKVYRTGHPGVRLPALSLQRRRPGVDGQTFEDIEAYGRDRWLDELTTELRERTYRPDPVRRVFIPKGDGKRRPLGIGSIRDRVAQMAVVLVLEPIFEADLPPEQHAYRADHSALDAIRQVHGHVSTGHSEVVDADLSGYFDSIPHAELMKSLSRRISDRHLLGLIKMWLVAPVEETDERGRKRRTTRNKDERRGSPQGSPLSPFLANIYMRRFIVGWKVLGHERRLDAHIVNYADDFVICCRGTADEAMTVMRGMMSQAPVDGERDEDAAVSRARGDVRLPGVYDRAVLVGEDGEVLHRDEAVGEEDRPPQAGDQRPDEPEMALDGCRRPSGATEPDASGLVELLLPRPGQCLVSSHRPPRAAPAPSVALWQAQA